MSGGLRVLIVDDSDADAELSLIELRRAGYAPSTERVDTAEAMRSALVSSSWDIVLSDHSMPQFSGDEALRVLRAADAELPFILVSGSIGESLAVAIMKAGASDYIRKDELSTLAPAVERALHEADLRREHRRAVEALRKSEEALKEQLELTQRQKEDIRRLSTPIIEVWSGVLTVPVLGALDEKSVAQMMESLLAAVVRARSRHVIVDLTAVASVDAGTADHLVKLISAVALLGARGIVVGIQPQVAQAIVSIGVDLARIKTLANLREALVYCMKMG
jgi:anti-anti-sigma regulatory factor/FixJ family two-component response regulator